MYSDVENDIRKIMLTVIAEMTENLRGFKPLRNTLLEFETEREAREWAEYHMYLIASIYIDDSIINSEFRDTFSKILRGEYYKELDDMINEFRK